MKQSIKSLSLFEFQEKFSTKEDCLIYLSELKWSEGFHCRKCNHNHYCDGAALLSRQCTRCNYTESPTANTLFHKVKFNILTWTSQNQIRKKIVTCTMNLLINMRNEFTYKYTQRTHTWHTKLL